LRQQRLDAVLPDDQEMRSTEAIFNSIFVHALFGKTA